ncbi:hypothetical protein AAMO2058_001330600 [Amorphochlora amoebiformis]
MSDAKPRPSFSPSELSCLQRCQSILFRNIGIGIICGGGVSAIAARNLRASGIRAGIFVGASCIAGGLAGCLSSSRSCLDEVMKLDKTSPLRQDLVQTVFHWNGGLVDQVYNQRTGRGSP